MSNASSANSKIITVEIRGEYDVVAARQRARQITSLLGYDPQDQSRISTAVSEIARNAYQYAGGGKVDFEISQDLSPMLLSRISDSGPGIPNIQAILDGRYASPSGLGIGLIGAKKLMDQFEIETDPKTGTRVCMGKALPKKGEFNSARNIPALVDELTKRTPESPFQEIQRQNHELVRALQELQLRQNELAKLNGELEETNHGVLALYAELDEKAEFLKKASEAKTSFLSSMTHEFRTPVNSILSLSRLLLDRADGELTADQEKQITFIQKSARALSDLVNDLLDLAKVEAGKVVVRSSEFHVNELFRGLKGILRPLLSADSPVSLIFEDVPFDIPMQTDEGKLSQILRNFISNALKYTETGEIRVHAELLSEGGSHFVRFFVEDTGIGIAEEDQERIFEEFVQIESSLQHAVKGTGLGLSLSLKLARLLGGDISVQSQKDKGSIFALTIPRSYQGEKEAAYSGTTTLTAVRRSAGGDPLKILVIDDDEISRYLAISAVTEATAPLICRVLEAKGGVEGIQKARSEKPGLIILDLTMPDVSGFEVLSVLKSDPTVSNIPIIINSSVRLGAAELQRLGRATAILSKEILAPEEATQRMREALEKANILAAKRTVAHKGAVNG